MTARILLLGADGQVGWELRRALLPLGEVVAMNRAQADLSDLVALRELLERERPDIVVNAAAYTAVDKAETDADRAMRVNAEAPELLARHVAGNGGWLVHYSTDYVFDGAKTSPYVETDATHPRSVYGRSKLAGEQAIAHAGCRHLVLRTSWVYAARGGNFARTMLRLAGERDELRVVADQTGAPTSAELIADVTALALHRLQTDPELAARACGLYHLAAAGATTWHGYARFVVERGLELGLPLRCAPDRIEPIVTADYPLPAPRPANSRLDCARLESTFGIRLPPWEIQVERLLAELAR